MIKKTYLVAFVAFCLSSVASAQSVWNARYQNYINQYKDCAIEQMLKWKIPASITLAQGLLESGAGDSDLARKANNHFGIKCHGWTGRSGRVVLSIRMMMRATSVSVSIILLTSRMKTTLVSWLPVSAIVDSSV